MENEYSIALKRLVSLGGSDEGFYLLALHSFLEGFSNTIKDGYSYYANFSDVVYLLMDYLEERGLLYPDVRKALIRMQKEHDLANRVRHQFRAVTKDEATAATHNFLSFCAAFKIEDPALQDLRLSLRLFDNGKSGLQMAMELEAAKRKLAVNDETERLFLEKVSKYDEMEKTLAELTTREAEYRAENQRLLKAAEQRGEKNDELRKKLFEIRQDRDGLLKELEGYHDVGEYLQFLERFSNFTRTRLDFERSVLHLTPEQAGTVAMIRSSGDYIIKGGAGTGKTIVLLHALENYIREFRERLALEGDRKVLLLTYTTTLVKYSRYLTQILGRNENRIEISTADALLFSKLKACVVGGWIDWKAPGNLISTYNTVSFLSDQELATEIENVIWGNLVTREEYLEKPILRRGMKQPLSKQQRELVWNIQDKLREDIVASKRYTRNLACGTIIRDLEQGEANARNSILDRVFIDEAQDLSTATIRCLKSLSRSGIILAADDGQSIYKIGAPYQRAGLTTNGHIRILKRNFRNTRQIHEFAERFLSGETVALDEERITAVNREGPNPELVTADTEPKLYEALKAYLGLAVGRLGYDPENIGILVPSNLHIETMKKRLQNYGYACAGIRDNDFSFSTPGLVRLSTLHSSKGIEFPVVVLWLPSMPPSGEFDEKVTLAMQRNLLYVALTRAMDHVIVLTLDEPKDKIVRELVERIRGTHTMEK